MPSEPSIILSYSETGRQQALGHVESWLRGRCACGHCGGPERAGTGLVLVSCASGVLGSSCTISIQLWEEKRLGRICAAKVKVRVRECEVASGSASGESRYKYSFNFYTGKCVRTVRNSALRH